VDTRRKSSIGDSLRSLSSDGWIPDLIVTIQSWPDEYSRDEIEQLNRLAPLARCVVCYGAWCESDGRTRDLWPLAVRIPIRQAQLRLQTEWGLLLGTQSQMLPMSASREEIFGADHPNLRFAQKPVQIVIDSPDPEYRRYVQELLINIQLTIGNETARTTAPGVLIFDADPWGEGRRLALKRFVDQNPDCRVLALASFPDPGWTEELLRSGVDEVLPKLCNQQRILDAIEGASVQPR
jgi:hypothetical protein